ncbi:hypothetical protein DSUL_20038 [Desulfovibrionales bacterium]
MLGYEDYCAVDTADDYYDIARDSHGIVGIIFLDVLDYQ